MKPEITELEIDKPYDRQCLESFLENNLLAKLKAWLKSAYESSEGCLTDDHQGYIPHLPVGGEVGGTYRAKMRADELLDYIESVAYVHGLRPGFRVLTFKDVTGEDFQKEAPVKKAKKAKKTEEAPEAGDPQPDLFVQDPAPKEPVEPSAPLPEREEVPAGRPVADPEAWIELRSYLDGRFLALDQKVEEFGAKVQSVHSAVQDSLKILQQADRKLNSIPHALEHILALQEWHSGAVHQALRHLGGLMDDPSAIDEAFTKPESEGVFEFPPVAKEHAPAVAARAAVPLTTESLFPEQSSAPAAAPTPRPASGMQSALAAVLEATGLPNRQALLTKIISTRSTRKDAIEALAKHGIELDLRGGEASALITYFSSDA